MYALCSFISVGDGHLDNLPADEADIQEVYANFLSRMGFFGPKSRIAILIAFGLVGFVLILIAGATM